MNYRNRPRDPDLDQFKSYLKVERGLSDRTVYTYSHWVQDWLKFSKDKRHRGNDVRAWTLWRGGAPSYVSVRLAAVRAWCVFSGTPDLTADVSRPKARKAMPRPVEDLESKLEGMEYDAKWAAIFLSETGLRLSEAYSVLQGGGGVEKSQILRVCGKGGKERLVPLTPKAQRALEKLHGKMPNSPKWLQEQCRKAGFTPHQLRHTFATRLVNAGADIGAVSKLMGHASVATTASIYAAYGTDRLKETVALLGRGTTTA